MHQVLHTPSSQLSSCTRNRLTPQRMPYQPEDVFGTPVSLHSKYSTQLVRPPIQGCPLENWCRSQQLHHDKRDLEVESGYASSMHRSEPDVTTDYRYRSLSEGGSAIIERCSADIGVNANFSKAFTKAVDSLVHQSRVSSKAPPRQHQCGTSSPATDICGTASSSSQVVAHYPELLILLLEVLRKLVELQTFLSQDHTGQFSEEDLKGNPERRNNSNKKSSGAEVSPTDASDIRNDQSSKPSLSTSEHHNQQKQHKQGSKNGKREDEQDDGEDDSHGGESPGQNSRRLSETETSSRPFACPYEKRFSGLLPKYSSCCFLGFATVNLMK